VAGKSIALKMILTSEALERLQQWYAKHRKDQEAALLSVDGQ